MTFEILPLGPADIPESFAVAQRAFIEFNRLLFKPNPISTESAELIVKGRIQGFNRNPKTRNFKAVDCETGSIIAAARWTVYPEDQPLNKSVEEIVEAKLQPRVPELRENVARAFYTMLNQGKREVAGIEKDKDGRAVKLMRRVELESLFTHPSYQRKGAAKALLQRCIQEADTLGLVVYLEATQDGQPLYEKCGFEAIRTHTFEAEKPGGEGTHQYTVCLGPSISLVCKLFQAYGPLILVVYGEVTKEKLIYSFKIISVTWR
jgi:GNAT superfamily N-acetyltransferase